MKRFISLMAAGILLACCGSCTEAGNEDEPVTDPEPKSELTVDYSHPEYLDNIRLTIDSARAIGLFCIPAPSDEFFKPAFDNDTTVLKLSEGETVTLRPIQPTQFYAVYRWDGDKLYIHTMASKGKPALFGDFWFFWPQKFEWAGIDFENCDMSDIIIRSKDDTAAGPICIIFQRYTNVYYPWLTSDPSVFVISRSDEHGEMIEDLLDRVCEFEHAFGMSLAGGGIEYNRIINSWAVLD